MLACILVTRALGPTPTAEIHFKMRLVIVFNYLRIYVPFSCHRFVANLPRAEKKLKAKVGITRGPVYRRQRQHSRRFNTELNLYPTIDSLSCKYMWNGYCYD